MRLEASLCQGKAGDAVSQPASIYTAGMISCAKVLNWGEFLARPAIEPPAYDTLKRLHDTPVFVVGAGGSIGSALALRIAALEPPLLVLMDASENNLYALQRQWAEAGVAAPTEFRLGSVGDRALLEEIVATHSPGLVFHAGAFKQVPLLEEQPLVAIENNVFGTLSLVQAASSAHIILLSTDKAVAPASIMGATKRLAEQIVLSAGGTALRLGNVLASRGSVVEVFAGQIAAGGPLSVTGPEVSRYFVTINEAVNMLLAAALEPDPPVLLAPALPAPHGIADLARFMIRELAPDRPIPVHFTGLRAGDKETERFWSGAEAPGVAQGKGMISITSPALACDTLHGALARLRNALDARDVSDALSHMQALVPDYEPSQTVLSLAAESSAQVMA